MKDAGGRAILTTARIGLRAWTDADRGQFAALFNTPEMTAHLGGPLADAALDALFDKRIVDQAQDGLCYWAMILHETGDLVGSAGLRIARNYPGTPVDGMLEAGWRVATRWQNCGLACEAMRGAIEWCWRHRRDDCIGSWTRAENIASLRLMRALGFVARPELDFDRPGSGERCLVHLLERPVVT